MLTVVQEYRQQLASLCNKIHKQAFHVLISRVMSCPATHWNLTIFFYCYSSTDLPTFVAFLALQRHTKNTTICNASAVQFISAILDAYTSSPNPYVDYHCDQWFYWGITLLLMRPHCSRAVSTLFLSENILMTLKDKVQNYIQIKCLQAKRVRNLRSDCKHKKNQSHYKRAERESERETKKRKRKKKRGAV